MTDRPDVDESPPRYAAVILAAGEATRMGTPKQVLPYGSSTLVGSVVETAMMSGVSDVVVVTGFHAADVAAAVGDVARTVTNPDAASGNMSSLVRGLGALDDVDGAVVLLCDMPEVSAATIDALIAGVVASGSAAGWVDYLDGRGHPIVLAASVIDDVRALDGPKALWRHLESLDPCRLFVLAADTKKPIDVNTAEDYELVTRRGRSRETGRG